MKYIGFGCSWMYGSEMEEHGDTWHEKEKSLHDRTFLGLLGDYENYSLPGNSNLIMFHQFTEWFNTHTDFSEFIVVFAMTDPGRSGFYDKEADKWVSSQWINPGDKFFDSYKEYIGYTNCEKYERITHNNIALSVSSICETYDIKYIIFNVLNSYITPIPIKNYFWQGNSMIKELYKNKERFLHEFDHPTEEGHKWIAGRVKEFIDTAYPGLL